MHFIKHTLAVFFCRKSDYIHVSVIKLTESDPQTSHSQTQSSTQHTATTRSSTPKSDPAILGYSHFSTVLRSTTIQSDSSDIFDRAGPSVYDEETWIGRGLISTLSARRWRCELSVVSGTSRKITNVFCWQMCKRQKVHQRHCYSSETD